MGFLLDYLPLEESDVDVLAISAGTGNATATLAFSVKEGGGQPADSHSLTPPVTTKVSMVAATAGHALAGGTAYVQRSISSTLMGSSTVGGSLSATHAMGGAVTALAMAAATMMAVPPVRRIVITPSVVTPRFTLRAI